MGTEGRGGDARSGLDALGGHGRRGELPTGSLISFATHRKNAGISTGTLHILRHTAATLMLTTGIPVNIAAARLGDHPKTVLSSYAHLLPQSDELAAERVAAAICYTPVLSMKLTRLRSRTTGPVTP